jgi:predicted Zn-dependent peptidase
MDTPQDWVHTLIDQACWPDTALGRDVAGTRESVAGLARAGLLAFMDATYLPAHTVVSIAGAIEAQEAIGLADRMFGGWRVSQELSGQLPDTPVAYHRAQPEIRYEQRDTEQVNLCLATRGVSRVSDDRYAFELLASILGGGMSSRLFLEVRERRALAYDIHSYTNKLADTGSLVTYAAVEPGHCREVVAEIVGQLQRLCTDPVPDSELGKVKDYYKGRLLLGLEDTQSVAGWCGVQQQLQGSIQQPEEVCSAVDRVSAGDLQRLAADCFQSDFLRLVALGPLSGAEGLEDALCLR